MTLESPETSFLLELFRQTEGDPGAKVSMHAVGEAVGLDKTEAGKMAETLIGQGWAEIKTLSGGIGITPEGLDAARAAGASGAGGSGQAVLGTQPLMDEGDRQTIEELLADIKAAVQESPAPYEALEALIIDIKTIEVHLLSPRAKTAVVRQVLLSIKDSLESLQQQGMTARIQSAIGNPA